MQRPMLSPPRGTDAFAEVALRTVDALAGELTDELGRIRARRLGTRVTPALQQGSVS
jgi:hypothetical protein